MSQDPQLRALLDERARRLAARWTNAARRELVGEVVLIEVGRERYGIPLAELREITRATPIAPLPGLPSFMLGVTAIRSELVTVIDLAELRGRGRTGNSVFYALVEASGRSLALCFESLLGIRSVFSDDLAPQLLTEDLVEQFTQALTRDHVMLLDIHRLLQSDRLIVGRRAAPAGEGRIEER